MADLDDFFAKKDKKKKGKGKKYASKTPQTLAEPTAQATEDDSTNKDVKIDIPNAQSKDEEWIEETEVVEDLEGLKVAPLRQEVPEEGSKVAPPTETTEDADGEKNETADKNLSKQVASPWQRGQAEDEESSEEDEEPPKPAHPSDSVVSGGKYIPPSMRGQATPTGGGGGRSRHKKLAPPDIQNTQAFPSLQASLSTTSTQADKDFTEVKGSKKGSRSADPSFSVELTNKFSTLS